jgi:hypothetical protein
LPGLTEDTYENPQARQQASSPKFKAGTPQNMKECYCNVTCENVEVITLYIG